MTDESYDWRKQAAMAATDSPSAEDVERSFMDLAYSYISQKAGPLLRDPYRLGFEVVYTNSDNDRMAGMFAFRIGRQLLSVPCFFMNGSVKGTELLYQHNRKLFCPLTDDWTRHLVSKFQSEHEGVGQSQQMTAKIHPGMRLERLAQPNFTKRANDETKVLWEQFFEEMEKHASQEDTGSPEPLLQEFLRTTEGAMVKLAAAVEASFDVATAVAYLPEETWDVEPEVVKSANDAQPDLVVYYDGFSGIKSASGHEGFKRGWYVLDTRPETDLNIVMCKAESEVTEVNEPGFHDIVCADGSLRRVFMGKKVSDNRIGNVKSVRESYERGNILVFTDDNTVYRPHGPVFGTPAEDMGLPNTDRLLKSEPSKGGCAVYDSSTGELSCPIHITKIEKRSDGVTAITYCRDYQKELIGYYNPDSSNVVLPDNCYCGEDMLLSSCCKFIDVKMEPCSYSDGHREVTSKHRPGTMENYWAFLANNGVESVSLSAKDDDMDGNKYTIQAGDIKCDTIDGPQTVIKLAHAFSISADDASALVDTVDKDGRVDFFVFLDNGMTKQATQVRIVDQPDFREEYDQDLNVRRESPQSFVLRSETTQPVPPARRLGDGYDPNPPAGSLVSKEAKKLGITDEDILSGNPEALAQFAQQNGTRNMVDHGVVGLLINTYDASSMVSKYIPKLEEGLDHFGRLIFLFHWKPSDFEKLYGTDDMSSIESNLVSQFHSYGDILLELIKRNEDIDGSAQMD
jgi:hypothetical protein